MTAGPLTRLARWRAGRIWLRSPGRALARLGPATDGGGLNATDLGLRAWLALTHERDAEAAERLARTALQRRGDTRFAAAALSEALSRAGAHDEAIEVLRSARARLPEVPWYELTLADALLEAGRRPEAVELLAKAVEHPQLRRHALKRLSRVALDSGDRAGARRWLEQLVALAPDYLVYASDYVALGRLALADGDRDLAQDTWRRGSRMYPRHAELRALRSEHFDDSEALAQPRIATVVEREAGATRMPVRTPLITPRTDLRELIDGCTAARRRPGDVLALAESATAAAQGRILPLELIRPGALARMLSRFVGSIGPLHSPEGMQGAIMESGRVRVVAGAIAGGLGRPFGRRGWFYRVAGPRTAMIDDVAACLPPHDHHLIFGPLEPDRLAGELAGALGCGVAIVDANHRTGAWVLAASDGVDREWVAGALADNPAGNEDERTPVVIVRALDDLGAPAGGARAPREALSC
jgi:tetratricopeptide (TPR) repeat protein